MTSVGNPILPGCHPDPSICRVGDTFYLVTSTFEYLPGLPVFRSRDLAHWERIGHVVDRPGQLDYTGIASSGGLYAPTLRHHGGLFWLVCTLVDQGDDSRGGNFLMTAQDPSGPWSDPVWLEADGIDPSIFFDDDGRAWVHGTRLAREPEWFHQTEVWLRELDLERRELVGPEHVLWTGALKGAVWAEGPHLYKVDGRYLLLAAEGGTEIHHAVCVARADTVTGPYEGSRANPVLTHRDLGRSADVVGVGHADLVQGADGSWWAVLLGMRPYGGYHYNLGRETFLVPVTWEDGWPLFAPGTGRVTPTVEVPAAVTASDDGATSGVVAAHDLRWTAVRALPQEVAVPHGEGWELPVRPATLADLDVPAFLGLRQQHRDVDVSAVLVAGPGPQDEVGLAVRQSEKQHVLLHVTGGEERRAVAVRVDDGSRTVLGEVPVHGGSDRVRLSVSARGQDYALLVQEEGAEPVHVATADGRWLDSVTTGGFLGLWIGVYATSTGRPTTASVTVEQVTYVPQG
ncbi:glycoside hydrolase family 43 protein [Actinotalea sp. Marseille-Q4924]|uniref:glycoside hydrolase family 43 protein n=1 Tax=Actinotalea sp. Marseille-Q4924 TaxID=2866571 RepID=UPI001CE4113A|nr:glycoside hydrolase family 43 protein [Actinotalea sp. Marseille-Q4924]